MTSLSQTRIPFKPLLLASALALLLGACGGGNNSGGFSGFIPPTSTAPPPAQPPAAQPEPDQLVSKARFTPNAGTTKGSSDASTAIALPDNS